MGPSLGKSVDEVIEDLPKNEQQIVKRLRALILDCLPHIQEMNTGGVPYYRRNRNILFIWPPSIYWGPNKESMNKKGVTLGFCQGNLMRDDEGLLKSENRKQVYCIYFTSVGEIDESKLRPLIFEADELDRSFRKKRKA